MYFIWINIIMKGIYDLSCSLDLVSSKLVAFIFKTVGNLLQYYKRIYSMQIHTSGFWYVKPHILSKRKNTPLSKQLHLTFELSCSAFQRVELYFNIKRAHIRYQHWFKSAPCDNFWAGIHVVWLGWESISMPINDPRLLHVIIFEQLFRLEHFNATHLRIKGLFEQLCCE